MTPAGKLEKSSSSRSVWPTRHIIYITIFWLSLSILGRGCAGRGGVEAGCPWRVYSNLMAKLCFVTKYLDRCGGFKCALRVYVHECVCVCTHERDWKFRDHLIWLHVFSVHVWSCLCMPGHF